MPHERMTPLVIIENAYEELASGPDKMTLDGKEWPGFQEGPFQLSELASALMGPDSIEEYVDGIWAHLIQQTRWEDKQWTIICAGLAMPGLRTATKRALFLAADRALQPDIESAALVGFTAALRVMDTDQPHLCRKLCNQAYISARRVANDHVRYQTSQTSDTYESTMPTPQARHIDLLLAESVRAGAITVEEAEVIAATRFEKMTLSDVASSAGVHPSVMSRHRQRAESRLVAWIQGAPLPDQGR